MSSGIYCYIDKKTNDVVYIGKDSFIDKQRRHLQHIAKSKYNSQPINRILQKNPNRYEYLVLEEGNFSLSFLNELEKYYIKKFNTFLDKKKFNYREGGEGGIVSEETRKKMRETHKGKKISKETRKKMSEAHKGRYVSEKTKKKLKKSLKGNNSGKNNPNFGKPRSKQVREKISKAMNSTGFFCVSKKKSCRVKQGFIYSYSYFEGGKRKNITSINIKKLEKKVKKKGLEWKKL